MLIIIVIVKYFYSLFQARMKATGELAAVKIIHIEAGVFKNCLFLITYFQFKKVQNYFPY